MFKFLKRTAKMVVRKVKKFVYGVTHHTETIVVLTLSAVGLNFLLSEVPFYMLLPSFLEGALVIPVISVLIISSLVRIAEWRHG